MQICDTHIHIVADPAQSPQAPDRTYTAGEALLPQIDTVAAAAGVTRFVIVQPSFYGTDNSVTLGAARTLGARGRAVAVIDPAAFHPDQAAAFTADGVRGLRLNLYSTLSAQRGEELDRSFNAVAAVAQAYGWHVQVIAPIAMLARDAALLAASPVPVVIDHYGVYGTHMPDSGDGEALLALLALPHVWIKLSAPYRSGHDPLALQADPAWIAAILARCAPRCVWGSDWPHTPVHAVQTGDLKVHPYRPLPYQAVLDGFRNSLPRGAADAILVDNPARLYGFE